jgi:hypothetical protein
VEYAVQRSLDVVVFSSGLPASDMGPMTKMRFGADESGIADGPVLVIRTRRAGRSAPDFPERAQSAGGRAGRAAVLIVAMALVVASAAAPSRAGGDVEAEPVRTGKERLGGKASDEQRVDNCKVPPDLRGPKPRPQQCGEGTGAKR